MNNKTPNVFICQVYGKNFTNIDGFRCFLEASAATLYNYDLGYICMGLLILIILISIFGGITANYRWFIVNQAFWDLLVCHTYSCANYTADYVKLPGIQCFYYVDNYPFLKGTDWISLQLFFIVTILANPFSALLLITSSRFIALYFMEFYDRLTEKLRILWTILIFNFIILSCDINNLFFMLKTRIVDSYIDPCLIELNISDYDDYDMRCKDRKEWESVFLYRFYNALYSIFTVTMYLKPPVCLILSSIATSLIMYKILKQAKFQIKHNRTDFFKSLRIYLVLLLQTLMNLFVFFIEGLRKIQAILPQYFGIYLYTSITYNPNQNYTGYLDFRLPLWLDGKSGLTDLRPRQMFTQIRVLFECLLILFIMTGYREAFISFIKFVFFMICNPSKSYQKFKFRLSGSETTTVTILSGNWKTNSLISHP